jgi:uncharacterized Zn-binding protein involved in type VI secretion
MPPAARIADYHSCPKVGPGSSRHAGGPVLGGEPTVLIGYQPAARVGDSAKCVHATDKIVAGEGTVLIGHKEAARLGDATAHGGRIAKGCPTVLIGSSPQADTLRTDKPFCEECERKKREREERRKRGRV